MENYTSDSSDSDNNSNKVLDLAYLLLEHDKVTEHLNNLSEESRNEIESIILHHNSLTILPKNLKNFKNIQHLDISNNGLTHLPDVFQTCTLITLIAKNNQLNNESLPKNFTANPNLKELNLSGNFFQQFPEQFLDFSSLKYLYLGGNKITSIPKNILKLQW